MEMKPTPKGKIERNVFMIKVHAFFFFFFKTKNSGGDLTLTLVLIVSLLERNVVINQRLEHYRDHVNENRGSVSMKKNKTKRVGHE